MVNRLNFNIENERVGEETAIKIKYMLEEKFQLERDIRAGEDAKIKLQDLETKLKMNMVLYAGIKGGQINV